MRTNDVTSYLAAVRGVVEQEQRLNEMMTWLTSGCGVRLHLGHFVTTLMPNSGWEVRTVSVRLAHADATESTSCADHRRWR
jgi:hypothetical protein